MRISPWLAAFLCALIAGLLWLALNTPSGTTASSRREFTAAEKNRAERDALWVDANSPSTRADDIDRVESAGITADPEATSAGEAAAALATTYGVRVRVIDEKGRPSIGWPVVLLREEPAWRVLAQSERTCAPGRRVPNCGLCHSAEEQDKPANREQRANWNPSQTFDPDSVIARGVSAAPDGELFFPLSREQSGFYRVRIESVSDSTRAMEFVPADPPPLVALAVSELEYVRISAVNDDWKLRPAALRGWIDREQVWLSVGREVLSLQEGTSMNYPVERSTPLRFEAWVEQPFAPSLTLEPDITDTGRELVLDARQAYVRGSVQIQGAEGSPLISTPLQVRLFDEDDMQFVTLPTNREGRLSFWLAAGTPSAKLRVAKFTTVPKTNFNSNSGLRFYSDLHEAHLDLSAAFTAGSDIDFGALRLGTGPILLEGRVIDEFGLPVPNAVVWLYSHFERLACDANGRFMRRGFPLPAEATMNARAAGFANWHNQVTPLPARGVEIVLHHTTSLQIEVIATPELLKTRVDVRLGQKGPEVLHNSLFRAGLPETFDDAGLVQFPEVPITDLRIEFSMNQVILHTFDYEVHPGANSIGPLDLMPLVRPLEFRFANAGYPRIGALLILHSAQGEIFNEVIDARLRKGNLSLYVPAACQSWVLVYDGKRYSGTVDQAQPISIS